MPPLHPLKSLAPSLSEKLAAQVLSFVPNVIQSTVPNLGPDPSGLIHQYTSLATLQLMAVGKFPLLRASSATYMNDSREFELGRDLFCSILNSVSKLRTPKWYKGFCEACLNLLSGADGTQAYCACFSKQGDHLGQWRGYGDQAKGCSIGFDYDKMIKGIGGVGTWVVYDPAHQEVIAKQIIDRLLLTTEMIVNSFKGGGTGDVCHEIALAAFEKLFVALCLLFKVDSFKEEEEFRIIYTDRLYGSGRASRGARLSNNFFVPFVELKMPDPEPLPVRQIMLGPGVKSPKHVRSVESLLDIGGLTTIPVMTSSIPFLPQ